MSLKSALSKIDASVEAYRDLLRDSPEDYEEAAERQQEAADLLAEAQTLGTALKGDDARKFGERFADANLEIESLETKRTQGGDDQDDEEPDEDVSENEDDEETAEMYSSLSHDEEDDEETPDENSEEE